MNVERDWRNILQKYELAEPQERPLRVQEILYQRAADELSTTRAKQKKQLDTLALEKKTLQKIIRNQTPAKNKGEGLNEAGPSGMCQNMGKI